MANTMEVLVPDIGGFKDVSVIDVMVKDGDTVDKETALITIETEKAAMDVPAPAAGRVMEMKLRRGDSVSEGSVILLLATEASDSASGTAAPTKSAMPPQSKPAAADVAAVTAIDVAPSDDVPATPAVSVPAPQKAAARAASVAPPAASRAEQAVDEAAFSTAHASPSVRKFAREVGADLGRISGTGPKARITQEDVKAFVKEKLTAVSAVEARAAVPAAGSGFPKVPEVDFAKFGAVESKPLSRIQKISGARLQASWMNLPHVTQHDEADITDLEAVRVALRDKAATEGVRLTPLVFIIKACIAALKKFPRFNASLDPSGENLVYKQYFNVGFAADTPNGLVVPVIANADRHDIFELARSLSELSERARAGKLTAAQMQGGSFTVSSLGGIGGTAFTPIINAPEVAILGISKARLLPVYERGGFIPRLMLPLSLSYDHRVIDGAEAARFIVFLSKTLSDVKGLT